jgi:hypothetical protein
VKSCGYPALFKQMIEDLKKIETDGIDIEYGKSIKNIKGTLSFFPSDNLAANGIGGFVESFNKNICM